jgi:Tfp pilus assembly protein PilN
VATELLSSRKGRIPRIDLMRTRREEQARARQTCRRDLVGLGALCVLAGGVFVPLSLRALTLQAQVRKAQRAAQSELHQVEQNAQTTGDVDARLAQWARFIKSGNQRIVWCDALHSLVAPMPPQIAVEHIQLDGKGDAITATLTGSGENIGVVRDYVGALERGAGLRQAHLAGASLDATFGPEAAKFTVNAQAGKAEK